MERNSTEQPQSQTLPPGFQKDSLGSEMTPQDRLAAAFYEQGSIPAVGGADEPLPPAPVREARAQAEARATAPQDPPEEEVSQPEAPPEPEPEPELEAVPEPVPTGAFRLEGNDLVTVNGRQLEVPAQDLYDAGKKHFQQEASYTAKSEALAAERRAFEQERTTGLDQRFQALDTLSEALENEIRSHLPDPAEVKSWQEHDPGRYAAHQLDMQRRQQLLVQANQQRQAVQTERRRQHVDQQRELLGRLNPAYAGEKFDPAYAHLGAWATAPEGGGLPPEVWNQTTDHLSIHLLHRLMVAEGKVRRQASDVVRVTKKTNQTPRVVRPSAPPEPGETVAKEASDAMARLAANQYDKDAQVDAWTARNKLIRERNQQKRSYR